MAYTKQTWIDAAGGGTPLSAIRLSYMEDGIAGAYPLDATGTADQVAINAAIDTASAAGGGIVELAAGQFDITAPIRLKDNVTLKGVGNGTILKLAANADGRVVTNFDHTLGNVNISLLNLQIDGNGANQTITPNNTGTGYDAVYFLFSTNIVVNNCYIHDANRHNLFFSDGCIAIRATNNRLANSLGLSNCSAFTVSDFTFANNVSSGANETGFKSDSSHTVTITGNTFFNNTTIQVYLTGGSSHTITGNSIRGGQNGVRIVSQDYTTVTGNSIRSCSQHGITLFQNVQYTTIAANVIREVGSATPNTYDGINATETTTACTYVNISNNLIIDTLSNMRYGIGTLSLTDFVELDQNTIVGAVTAPVSLVGANNVRGARYSTILSPGTIGTVNNATSYMIGTINNIGASTNASLAKFYVPRACTVTAAYVMFHNSGTLASAETSTIAVRVNNTTDTTISAAVVNNAVATEASNTGLNIALNAGDYIAIKWTTPNWGTPPTNVRPAVTVYFE